MSGWQRVCRVARMAAADGLPSSTVCSVLATSQVDCSAEASPSALVTDTSLYDTRHAVRLRTQMQHRELPRTASFWPAHGESVIPWCILRQPRNVWELAADRGCMADWRGALFGKLKVRGAYCPSSTKTTLTIRWIDLAWAGHGACCAVRL